MEKVSCTADYEKYAKKMLSPPMFEFINGPPNCRDSDEYLSIQLKLRGLANLKNFHDPLRANVLGNWLKSPMMVGAFPHQGMVHKDGEMASAKAAAELGQMFCLSASSTHSMEDVAKASMGGPKLLMIDARLPEAVRRDLIQRACKI